jgi:hypothetical protein
MSESCSNWTFRSISWRRDGGYRRALSLIEGGVVYPRHASCWTLVFQRCPLPPINVPLIAAFHTVGSQRPSLTCQCLKNSYITPIMPSSSPHLLSSGTRARSHHSACITVARLIRCIYLCLYTRRDPSITKGSEENCCPHPPSLSV